MLRNDNPLVSIITPSYKQGQFIEKTLLSIKNQDYPYIEHFILDGCSEDNTVEILKRYQGLYDMHWISEPDGGQAEAINKGFAMAKGAIIGWLNSDDVYFDSKVISYIVEQFKKFPEVDVLYGDDIIIDAESNILRIRRDSDWNYNRLLRGYSFSQPATFFRREVIRQNRLNQSLHFVMDFEFWLRLSKSHNFRHVSRILAADRIHRATKRLSGITAMANEAKEVEKRYGQTFGLNYYMLLYLVDLPRSIARRVLGIPHILRIERELDNLAFDARCRSKLNRLVTQMWIGLIDDKTLSKYYAIFNRQRRRMTACHT